MSTLALLLGSVSNASMNASGNPAVPTTDPTVEAAGIKLTSGSRN